jgi:hypothetical protein
LPALLAAAPASAQEDDDDDILVADDEPAAVAEDSSKKKIGLVGLVPVGDASKPLADQVTDTLVRELKEGPWSLTAIELGGDEGGVEVDTSQGAKDREAGDKQLARGRKALEKLQFGRAQKAFDKALAAYAKAAAALDDITPVIDAHVGLAEVAARQGKEEVSRAELGAVAQLDPEHNLDPAKFPPLFIRTHEEVRAERMKEKSATVVVDRSASGADVWINGRKVGAAPVRVKGLVAGSFFVRVYREGMGLFGGVVEVKAGAEETVKPGFLSADAAGPLDLLARNKFSDAAAKKIAEVARGKSLDVAMVGVTAKTTTRVPTALIAIEVATGKAARIKEMRFDGDLLNASIESLPAREALEELLGGKGWGSVGDEPLLSKVKAAEDAEMDEVALRFDVKAPPKGPRKTRVLGAEEEEKLASRRLGDDGEGGRSVLSAGRGGATKSLRDDEEDPLAKREKTRSDFVAEEDVPLLEQPWFWPVAIGTGVAGAVMLTGGTLGALVGAGIIPDPRPRTGMQVSVELTE